LLQNFMNFGPQTAQNRPGCCTHPHYLCYRFGGLKWQYIAI